MAAQQSDAVVITKYFGMDLPTARRELTGPGALPPEAKKELADGIRNGSLTYGPKAKGERFQLMA